MRLIDADECFSKNYPSKYDLEKDDYAYDLISAQPTVEAIPIEQVARMIDFVTDVPPCHYAYPNNSDWCKSQNCRNGKTDFYECWLNALKEGWLDNGTN